MTNSVPIRSLLEMSQDLNTKSCSVPGLNTASNAYSYIILFFNSRENSQAEHSIYVRTPRMFKEIKLEKQRLNI